MEAVRQSDVSVNSYLAVQAAVDQDEIRHGRLYEDVLDTNEIKRMAVTYTSEDKALLLHDLSGYDKALGSEGKIEGRKINRYDIDAYNIKKNNKYWFDEHYEGDNFHHYGYDHEAVYRVEKEFFGKNGENI
jgi:hypothetical protein